MPFDYSRFLRALEVRARKLRGLSAASFSLAGLSLLALAAMIAVRLLRIPLPTWGIAIFVLPPFVAATLGYIFGRARRPRIPHLLLQVDDTLGLPARLSSLYELRQRGNSSIFRQRLEAEVSQAIAGWQTALPIARRTIVGGSAGACCLALAVGLAFTPLPPPSASPAEILEETSFLPAEGRPEDVGPLVGPSTEATAPLTVKTDEESGQEIGVPTLETPNRGETLDDVMRDLAGASPDEAVIAPVAPGEIEGLAQLQSEALQSIAQTLQAIRDRLGNAPTNERSALTEEEMEALRQDLERGGIPPEMEQGINELMNPPDERSIEEMVEQLLDQFGPPEDELERSGDGDADLPETTAISPDSEDLKDFLDDLGESPSEGAADPGEDPDGSGPPDGTDAENASAGDRRPTIEADGEEDPDEVGGAAGSGSSPDETELPESDFLREEDRAKIGSEGDYVSEYVTEGVPVELMPSPDGAPPSYRVSYERIDSILRERGLPEGAIKIVRDYFNAITEGGS